MDIFGWRIFGLGFFELMPILIIIIIIVVIYLCHRHSRKKNRQNTQNSQQTWQTIEYPDQPQQSPNSQQSQPAQAQEIDVDTPSNSVDNSAGAHKYTRFVPSETPLLDTWKTSFGFSVLGFFVFIILGGALYFVSILGSVYLYYLIGSLWTTALPTVVMVVIDVICILYALIFYRSFFTKQPHLKSSRAISFWNLALGGIIFGCLWNNNLTKKHRGESFVVFVVLEIVGVVLYILLSLF